MFVAQRKKHQHLIFVEGSIFFLLLLRSVVVTVVVQACLGLGDLSMVSYKKKLETCRAFQPHFLRLLLISRLIQFYIRT